MKPFNRKVVQLIQSFALLSLLVVLVGADKPKTDEESAELKAIRQFVQAHGGDWTPSTDRHGKPTGELIDYKGKKVLQTTGRQTILTCNAVPKAPGEFRFLVRFTGEGNATMRLKLGAPLEGEKDSPIQISLTYRVDHERLSWFIAAPQFDRGARGNFAGDGIGPRSLSWDETFRKTIEAEQAKLPSLSEVWMPVRVMLLGDRLRLYMYDRMVEEIEVDPKKLSLTSPAEFWLYQNVVLRHISAKPIPEDQVPGKYETISMGSYLNAREIDGQKLAAETLKRDDFQPTKIDGIPFVIPTIDDNGNDHIDLGGSWVPGAKLSARSATRGATIMGRWAGALAADPTRVQFTVPPGRYKAVHLLAVADSDKDELPIVTAQFYRNQKGFPENFRTQKNVPTLTATNTKGVKVITEDGKERQLYHITIPVDPGQMAAFEGVRDLELELTKQVQVYRAYPDPMYYTQHGAGLPSSVRVFAVTVERPAVEMKLTPGNFADTWTAPEKPTYDVTLTNSTGEARTVDLNITTESWYEKAQTKQTQKVTVPANGNKTVKFTIAPPSHGYHDLTVQMNDAAQLWNEKRGLVWLHEDTRERGDWQPGRGPIFGFWNWRGGHDTPSGAEQTDLMGRAGAESSSGSFEAEGNRYTEEEKAAARKWGMITFKAFGGGDHYITARFAGNLKKEGYESAKKTFIEQLKKAETPATDINRPELISFFPEPHLGPISYGTPPRYYGGDRYVFSEAEQEKFELYVNGFIEGVKILKELYPNVKPMLPHGDPTFPVPIVQRSEEARKLFEGIAVDIPVFERMPEQQIHQVSLHRMYFSRDGLNEVGLTDPTLAMYEGPSRTAYQGLLSDQELADFSVRDSLLLYAYGVDRQMGGWAPFESASFWGEQHYGGGICHRKPRATPRPALAAFGTMTRHLNRRNYDGWIDTGSRSTYAMKFKHYKTGEVMIAMWTIRGQRPIEFETKNADKVVAYDLMDNKAPTWVGNGKVRLTLSSSPIWVYGLTGDETITLGEPIHDDAAPSKLSKKLASVGDGSWSQTTDRDEPYEKSFEIWVKRFPGNMTVTQDDAPAKAGGKALRIELASKQSSEQKIMPFYTAIQPKNPVTIPGKGEKLGLWVKGSDDWGRVIYSVIDAKGERWLSVGQASAWNCDDIKNDSAFAFAGWRYLTFELPANSAWDTYREKGTVWWGPYSKGDEIIDLPLKLEKIIVEKRTHAMYVTDPQPTGNQDTLIGDLFVEYASQSDMTDEVIRQSKIRMPIPTTAPKLDNPIAKMQSANELAPINVTGITTPEHHDDGTQCYVNFNPVEGEDVKYNVWVAPYADGRGAIHLGKNWTESGKRIRSMRPDTDFYIFVTYTKDKKTSKPGEGFKINLKDQFSNK